MYPAEGTVKYLTKHILRDFNSYKVIKPLTVLLNIELQLLNFIVNRLCFTVVTKQLFFLHFVETYASKPDLSHFVFPYPNSCVFNHAIGSTLQLQQVFRNLAEKAQRSRTSLSRYFNKSVNFSIIPKCHCEHNKLKLNPNRGQHIPKLTFCDYHINVNTEIKQ